MFKKVLIGVVVAAIGYVAVNAAAYKWMNRASASAE